MVLIAVDTTFLIDLQKDSASERKAIQVFLENHLGDEFCVSLTALGEFAAGFSDPHHGAFLAIRQRFKLAEQDEEVSLVYAKIFRELKKRGTLIGANDLWIAASALRHGAALATRNIREFQKVSGLTVMGY